MGDKTRYKGLDSNKVMRGFISAIMRRSIQDKKTGDKQSKREATMFLTSEYCEYMCELLNIDYFTMLDKLNVKADIPAIREHERKVRMEMQRLQEIKKLQSIDEKLVKLTNTLKKMNGKI